MQHHCGLFAAFLGVGLGACAHISGVEVAPTDLQIVYAGSGWYKVSTRKGGFQAAFPGQPTVTTDVEDGPSGPIDTYCVMVEPRGTVAFAVMYHRVPGASPTNILQSACDGAVRNANVIAERDIVLGGRAGRELIMERLAGQALVTLRVYVRDDMLYLVSVCVPVKQPLKEHTDQFLDSFAFLE